MKRFLILILLVLQAGFISAQDNDNHVGSYNPEEDMTRYNDTFGPDLLIWWADKYIDKMSTIGDSSEEYTPTFFDWIPSKISDFLGRIIFILIVHLLYTRLGFRRPKYNKDVNKVIYRYKAVFIVLGAMAVFSTFGDSFLLGLLMIFVSFWLVATLVAKVKNKMCPECCTYNHIRTEEEPLNEYTNEIYSDMAKTSQFLNADQIKPESLPKGDYKMYRVQKCKRHQHCTKCNAKWDSLIWKRIEELV